MLPGSDMVYNQHLITPRWLTITYGSDYPEPFPHWLGCIPQGQTTHGQQLCPILGLVPREILQHSGRSDLQLLHVAPYHSKASTPLISGILQKLCLPCNNTHAAITQTMQQYARAVEFRFSADSRLVGSTSTSTQKHIYRYLDIQTKWFNTVQRAK